MPFGKERCPRCDRNLHGLSTTKGPSLRCGNCQQVWTTEEFEKLMAKPPDGIGSGLVGGPAKAAELKAQREKKLP